MSKLERYATLGFTLLLIVYMCVWTFILPLVDPRASLHAFFPKDSTGFLMIKWIALILVGLPYAFLGFQMMLGR